MTEFDDELLAYAMSLGSYFWLSDPLPGKSKKTLYRETRVEARLSVDGRYVDRSGLVAHFIARLMLDRRVKIKDIDVSSSEWVIEDGRTGMQLRFYAPTEKRMRAHLAEASEMKVDASLEAVEAATICMRMVGEERAKAIVASRATARRWPPAEGSTEARLLALTQDPVQFEACRKIKGTSTWTTFKATTASAFLAKLKDLSLRIHEAKEHEHDSKEGKDMGLPPGMLFVEVTFSELNDAGDKPVSTYNWVAKVETPPVSKKDRVLALMKGAAGFRHSRLVNQSYGHTEYQSSNAAVVKRKLNDPSLFIAQIDVHPHDHPVSVEWNLQPDDTLVEVEFCKVENTLRTPTSFFRWFVPAETPVSGSQPSRPKSSSKK